MIITIRVHMLSLDRNQCQPVASLYRFDGVKSRKEKGWMDRMTIPAGDLTLSDLVTVTVEHIDDE